MLLLILRALVNLFVAPILLLLQTEGRATALAEGLRIGCDLSLILVPARKLLTEQLVVPAVHMDAFQPRHFFVLELEV